MGLGTRGTCVARIGELACAGRLGMCLDERALALGELRDHGLELLVASPYGGARLGLGLADALELGLQLGHARGLRPEIVTRALELCQLFPCALDGRVCDSASSRSSSPHASRLRAQIVTRALDLRELLTRGLDGPSRLLEVGGCTRQLGLSLGLRCARRALGLADGCELGLQLGHAGSLGAKVVARSLDLRELLAGGVHGAARLGKIGRRAGELLSREAASSRAASSAARTVSSSRSSSETCATCAARSSTEACARASSEDARASSSSRAAVAARPTRSVSPELLEGRFQLGDASRLGAQVVARALDLRKLGARGLDRGLRLGKLVRGAGELVLVLGGGCRGSALCLTHALELGLELRHARGLRTQILVRAGKLRQLVARGLDGRPCLGELRLALDRVGLEHRDALLGLARAECLLAGALELGAHLRELGLGLGHPRGQRGRSLVTGRLCALEGSAQLGELLRPRILGRGRKPRLLTCALEIGPRLGERAVSLGEPRGQLARGVLAGRLGLLERRAELDELLLACVLGGDA